MKNFNSKLNIREKALLELVSDSLFSCGLTADIEAVEWKSVWNEAYAQTVSLIAFSRADKKILERIGSDSVKKKLAGFFATNTRVDYEHIRLHRIMTEAKIPYTIIKGLSCALYYPDMLMRSMGDVDFLVEPENFDNAHKMLINNGFEFVKDSHGGHNVYTKNGCRFEMHYEPAGIPTGKKGERIREYCKSIVSEAQEVKTELGEIRVPSVFHHGLIILLHVCHHLTGEGIGLRHLCDWAMFISSMGDVEFRNIFEEKLRGIGLWQFACVLTCICADYLGCPCGNKADRAEKQLADAIIADVFSGGNFGQKNADRSLEMHLISAKGEKNIEENSMLKQMLVSANKIVYTNWKITRKLKFLLPFGWLFFGLRYVIRSVFGKRPEIHLKEIKREASARKKLYAELRLFEVE